ncbi:MAG TPA: PAS domain S-box protein [Ignavibacteria bacterium]|nr:PAS domain S-box protein [Ignavibacteria bacterium]HMQ99205.1 PAS domain S-box protein [Ignavibacteria bacterium]
MEESNKSSYLEQLANLTFDYTYLLKVGSNDEIVPEIIAGSFEHITGFSLEELREKNFFLSTVYEEDLVSFIDYWGKVISGKPETIITRILTKLNEIKWVKIYSKPIVDEGSGNIKMIVGAVQDITEQKLMEEVLRESESTYKSLLESMGEGLILADNNDHILYVNRKFTELVGYSKSELIGKIGYNIFVDTSERNRLIAKNALRETGISDSYETVFIAKDGRKMHVVVSGSPYKNSSGKVIGSIGVVKDITDHKRILAKISKQKDEIDTLYQAGKRLTLELNAESIFNTVFDVILGVVDFSELFVAKYDPEDGMIRYIYMRSVNGSEPVDVSTVPAIPLAPEGYGILSDVIRKSVPIILNDYQQTLKRSKTIVKVSVSRKQEMAAMEDSVSKPQSAIIVPIKLDEEVIGVIQLYSQNKDAYNLEQMVFLEALMQQASLAYHNAMLFQKANAEIRVRKQAEEELSSALDERELLLKEIYHRVKNNLQVVSSLLKMQSEKIADPDVKKYFLESRDKVNAISLIHEKLYNMRDLSKIDFSDYINSLVRNIKGMHTLNEPVNIKVDSEKLTLPIDIAMPCGLILNELILNALKHPFSNESKNPEIQIKFSFDSAKGKYSLKVIDNGKGFPEGIELGANDTMGLKLVATLTSQIDGTIRLVRGNLTEIVLEFPPSSYEERI